MSRWHILGRPKGSTGGHIVLNLDPATRADAMSSIAWQHQPRGFSDFEWRICKLENGVFIDDEGNPHMVHSAPYTAEAWDRFCRTYGVHKS
ncbi:MAG TPA: hypothetical protein H9899_07075 [Candidatus Sphingomonas excrementigallinarum]|nr:hypothetical protein [Candidatus Sphingomonas excrementigallinarum]